MNARVTDLEELSALFRLPVLRFEEMRACRPAFDLVACADALRRKLVLLRAEDGALLAALGDPYDATAQDWLEENVREPFAYRLADRAEIEAYLAREEQALSAMQDLDVAGSATATRRDEAEEVSIAAISESDSPVVKLVTSTLYDALKCGASDIHLETSARGLMVKYRIDGVISVAKTVDGIDVADQVLSRIKVIAELDIAERRVPQDGRFKARRDNREIDLRVSIMPSVFGEDAVLRILDKQGLSGQLTLDALGFDNKTKQQLRALSAEPHGMLLVTGPTGSGKTTTLYGVISEANDGVDKIVTIEDPVEYQLSGVLQIPVNEKKGLTFARGLRSILRHDPDRILVGEIRDPETAEIAVQSALTGHLVYTTVHANNVFDVIGRFTHMGVDAYNLASALNAVLAQRLVRTLCGSCRGKGCSACRGTGFKGRKAVAELLVFDDELKDLVAGRAPMRRLKDAARAAGGRTLREAAEELVALGETTQAEIDRVTVASR